MKRRLVLSFAILGLAGLLIGCDNGAKPPPEATLATVNETVTAADTLMSDVVSLVAGFGSNAFIQDPGVPTCSTFDCGVGSVLVSQTVPVINLQFYDIDENGSATNMRLATGTFIWDIDAESFVHTPATASLSFTWPHTGTGELMELHVNWQNIMRAGTHDVDVPGGAQVSFKRGATELLSLDVTQTLANTSCGRLLEYRTVSASGFFNHGGQEVRLDSFKLDHSSDEALAISLVGSVSSGSLNLPFSASLDLTAGAVTRDATTCQLNGVEGPLNGSVELWVGSQSTGLGLGFEFGLTFVGNDVTQLGDITFEGAKLGVGQKHVLITGTVETDELTGALVGDNLLLTFLDRVEMPVLEFGELLTFPESP